MDDETKKQLQNERMRIYREANRDKAKKYRDEHKAETKAYYLKNKDVILQNQVEYRLNNTDMIHAKQKLDRQKPATQQRMKLYRETHKDEATSYYHDHKEHILGLHRKYNEIKKLKKLKEQNNI